MSIMNWGNLEYVLTVAQKGSLAAAARALKVDHTTVLRRVSAFESQVKVRIFERLRSGYILTPEGEVFLDAAKSIEATIADLDRKIAGSDTAISGEVSITTTDSIIHCLTPEVNNFRSLYSEIIIKLTITNDRLDLDSRDADIAIRASNSPPSHLVGQRVCNINFGIYGAPSILKADMKISLETCPWLGTSSSWSASHVGEWMMQNVSAKQIILKTNSFVSQCALAEHGIGLAILPRFMGDSSSKLEPVSLDLKELSTELWLLSHKDILRSRRVQAATDFFYRALKAKEKAFEG
ncbi:MAG: LysR family transcriptional regulator [Sneathiella sp.]|nr:LysR family transcriptional regulator [Sneathiella sp.]